MSLYKIAKNCRCIIEKIPKLSLLKSMGVREGITVSIITKQPFGGPVVIQIGKRNIAIARTVAELIDVRQVL